MTIEKAANVFTEFVKHVYREKMHETELYNHLLFEICMKKIIGSHTGQENLPMMEGTQKQAVNW